MNVLGALGKDAEPVMAVENSSIRPDLKANLAVLVTVKILSHRSRSGERVPV